MQAIKMKMLAIFVVPFLVKKFPKKPVINADNKGINTISKYIFLKKFYRFIENKL